MVLDVTQTIPTIEVPTGSEGSTFVASLLMLTMIAVCLNLAHFLKHKKFNLLSESAIYILFGIEILTRSRN